MSKITDEIVEAMIGCAPLDHFKAIRIAEAFDVKPKAVIASATRRGIEYITKPRVSKTGAPIVTKEDLVGKTEVSLGFGKGELAGLEKATKDVLSKVVARLDELADREV